MDLFYAYLKDDQGDSYRHLITFVSSEVADEWWRMISTSPSPYAGKIRRISPQFYTQSDLNVANFFTDMPDAQQWHQKMFITTLWNTKVGRIPFTIRPGSMVNHISGRWYFIRSKVDPFSHWYVRVKGTCLVCGEADCDAVHVSSEYRTKFCIRARNQADEDPQEPEDFVMIGRDEISITAPQGHTLHIDRAEHLLRATKAYQGESDLHLGDLKNRFITQSEKQVNGEVWEYVVGAEKGAGEAWGLID